MHSFVCVFHVHLFPRLERILIITDIEKTLNLFLVAADSVSYENISQEFGQYNYKNAGVIIWAKVKC